MERKDINGFRVYRRSKGHEEKYIKDDMTRIGMMKRRGIDYTKGEDYARQLLYNSNLSESSIVSCLRVCRYYKEYLDVQ